MSGGEVAVPRMYGGWRRARGLGVGGLDTGQTVIVVCAVLVPIGIADISGLGSLPVTLPVAVAIVVLTVWQRHGMPW